MPYRAIETTKLSLCGDSYVEISVVFTPDDVLIDQELGDEISEFVNKNSRILDPQAQAEGRANWDEIPF